MATLIGAFIGVGSLGGVLPLAFLAQTYMFFTATPEIRVGMFGIGRENERIEAVVNANDFVPMSSTMTYQWWRSGQPIPGAVSKYYTLTQADVGMYISVVACVKVVTTAWGTDYYKAESAAGLVENQNSPVTGSVTITGTPTQNQVLTASNTLRDDDGLGPITYTWIRDTAPQNTLPTGVVGFSGGLVRGNVLTAANTLVDIDGLGQITYTWNRDLIPISGATGTTYTLVQGDVGKKITVTASYIDGLGAAQSVTSSPSSVVQNVVTIRGRAEVAQRLTVANTIVGAVGEITYQWRRNGGVVFATGDAYTTNWYADGGQTLTVTASYRDSSGTVIRETSVPTNPIFDQNSSANYSLVTGSDISTVYVTDANAIELSGVIGERIAIGSTYTLTQADVGYYLSAVATYTDPFGHVTSVTSMKTAQIANVNDPLAGELTISGTPAQYQVLTANTSGLSDLDGLGAFTYQWNVNGLPKSGSTSANYALTITDVGKYITVTVSYTDPAGAAESKTSAATAAVVHVNTPPTGSVTINGTPTQNQVLTVSNTLGDVDGLGPITYQWNVNGLPKSGGTGATYTLSQADVGKTISVTASYTDLQGTAESVTSAATAAVANANDPLTGAAYIIGNAVQYQVLTAVTTALSVSQPGLSDVDGLGAFSYQWKRSNGNNFDNILNATGRTYTLTQDDVGRGLKVTVSYTDGYGTVESYTTGVTAIVTNVNDSPTGAVTITGTPTENQLLTVTNNLDDKDGLPPVLYQWCRNGVPVWGANGTTYSLTQADVGKIILVTATYYDGQSTYECVTSNKMGPIANVNDPLLGNVYINGIAEQYKVLVANTGELSDADGMGTLAYQWCRNGIAINGANGSSYWLTQDDVDKQITVIVTSTDSQGTAANKTSDTVNPTNINDLPGGEVTINGTPAQNQVLTVTHTLTDLDGMVGGSASPITYQWKRDGVAVPGATGSTYALSQADVGTSMTVTASYMDSHGNAESKTSARTDWVANVVDIPTGSVTIAGTAAYNQVLTATNNLTDADGINNLYYEWKRNGANISGATGTGSTYKLTLADVGKQMTVIAFYFDGTGVEKSVTSAATATVVRIDNLPTGAVTITGTPYVNAVLGANVSGISDLDGIFELTYQWKRGGITNVGGNINYYTVTSADLGYTISVTVNVIDNFGTVAGVTSTATAVVTNAPNQSSSVTISGSTVQGATLTASNTLTDVNGMGVVSYKWNYYWYGTSYPLPGPPTGSTYTLTPYNAGQNITVTASYTNGLGALNQVTSAPTAAVINVDDPLTGDIVLTGTAQQGQILSATHNLADLDGITSITFQWNRNGTPIPGVTDPTSYRLVQADVGSQITLTANIRDTFGAKSSKTSAPTAIVTNVNDSPPWESVTITGILAQNQVLTANTSAMIDPDGVGLLSYQWMRAGVNISGATGSTYKLTQSDVRKWISVKVSYIDNSGTAESVTSAYVATTVVDANDPPTGSVTITGTPATSQVLTASHNLSDPDGDIGTVTYKWKSDGVEIATGSTYTLTPAEVNKKITVTASYTDSRGGAGSVTSDPTVAVAYANSPVSGTVIISGTPTQNEILTVSHTLGDLDGLGTLSYQWIRGTDNISGATSSTYTLTQSDVGKSISVKISYIDLAGNLESKTSEAFTNISNANDLPTGTVTISGTAAKGSTLTASNDIADLDGMGTVTYFWKRNGTQIATGSTYTLVQADVGKTITATASFSDSYYNYSTITSAATVPVVNVNNPLVGRVAISGTALQGQTLFADTTGMSDTDGRGTGYIFIWMRDGVALPYTGSASYTLGQADVGKQITLTASYTDLGGTYESSTSLPTAPVANLNDSPAGFLFIDGDATQNQVLTATPIGLSDADGLGPLSYQWMRNGVDINLATNTTYKLVEADVGKAISVKGSYTDGFGALETITSTATPLVRNINDSPTGTVTISGTAAQYQILTASNTMVDLDGLGPITYRWKRNGVIIAVGTSYTLSAADVGSKMTVTAVYEDLRGTWESVGITSEATATVVHVNAPVTGEVTISRKSPVTGEVTTNGTPMQNGMLTAITDGLSDVDGLATTFTYQWKSDGVNILDATNSTYTLTTAEVGKTISVTVSYTDLRGNAESKTSAVTAPVANLNDAPIGDVLIIGSAEVNQLLTVSYSLYDADGLGPISYQWTSAGYNIPGATGSTYTLTPADESQYIRVVVSYIDGYGTAEDVTSTNIVGPIRQGDNLPTGTITINGLAKQGQTLTFTSTLYDMDGMASIEYIWKNTNNVTLGTGTSYTLTQADVGSMIKVVAVCTDVVGTTKYMPSNKTDAVTNENDSPIGKIIIVGTPAQNGDLYADISEISDLDGLTATFTYQWFRNGIAINGATGSVYTLVETDVGKQITVTAQYTDGFGAPETVTSDPTIAVANVNDPSTGTVTIDGLAQQGELLTATSVFSDDDGVGEVSYQWKRGATVISGPTGSTYTLVQADVGYAITVVASYTDGHGTVESATSDATAIVVNVNDLPVGLPIITGIQTQGQVLTADTSGISDLDGLGAFSYQWRRKSTGAGQSYVSISGATSATYTLTQDDVSKYIMVVVSYTDGYARPEIRVSAETALIANANDLPSGKVTITGTPTQGQVLTVSHTLVDIDGLGQITYQWKSGGFDISGATGVTYTLREADVGKQITVVASYTDGFGAQETVSSDPTASVVNVNDPLIGDVTISGTATQGELLTASNTFTDADGMGTVSYQWKRGGVAISGAIGSTYALVQEDVGYAITVLASYTDGHGTVESKPTLIATASVANANDSPTGSVTISGTPTQKQVLTAITSGLSDLDGLGAFSYQWMRAGSNISGATASTYTLGQADVGQAISVKVSYTDGFGAAESKTSAATAAVANVNDLPTGSVTISGTPEQNQVLTASNTLVDIDGLGPITYQWKRDGAAISGATGTTYTLVQADVGRSISVLASYTDLQGAPESYESDSTVSIANVNDPLTGSVTIAGTATQGQLLTASNTLADADGMGPISYQWKRGGVAISGMTGPTYMLVQADVNSAITVTASYTDLLSGATGSATSAATAPVANVNDLPTGAVTITGTPTQNQVLTASHTLVDIDGLGAITYQWKRAGSNISGATGSTYTLVQADVGFAITVVASYTDLQGTAESVTSAATTAVVNVNDPRTGSVTISGTATQGQTLTVSNTLADLDGMGTVSYQWRRGGADIAGATGSTYTLVQADVGRNITVFASYTDLLGTYESYASNSTAAVANVNDPLTGDVTITGTPTQNQILTASNTLVDIDGLGPITYQWKRGGAAISGATGSTYTLVQADVGLAITVTASYTDLQGTAESKTSAETAAVVNVNDLPTGSVTISGTPTQNQILTAITSGLSDLDGLGLFNYQWMRAGTNISGATGSTYTLVQADVGSAITVTASYTDVQGTPESKTSAATAIVANVNDSPTGSVTISGTPTQNQVLTASNTLEDIDGLGAITYQWKRGGVAISGATGSTYTLVQADVGSGITVTASYTDLQGTAESVTSLATTAIANVNDPVAGEVTISGTPTQNQVLTAITSGLSDLDGLTLFNYQWMRAGSNISGATGSTYTLVQADVGFAITVKVSYTDGFGAAESKTSAATALVANVNDPRTGSVTISGTPTQNQVLTVSNTLDDLDGMGTVSYQWRRGGADIAGATGSTYTLTEADVGRNITVFASYTDLLGTYESYASNSTAAVANVNDPLIGDVTITGTATQYQVLTASNTFTDVDGMGTVSYQWKRGGVAISGAIGSTYTLVQADVGYAITVLASYTDGHGTVESKPTLIATAAVANVNDSPTGSVTISGTPTQNQILTVSNTLVDIDGLGAITYQWKRGGAAISGATGTSYTLVQADVGSAITVTASYTDLQGTAESKTSVATAFVANVNDSPTGSVTITGTPTQNQVLTVSHTLGDVDGMGMVSYQWKRGGVAISGATGSTYTLVQADVGSAITVTASYTDLQGTSESVTSLATIAVANVNDPVAGEVTISGTPTQYEVLTAITSGLSDLDGLGLFNYQWMRDGSDISLLATGSTYTLVQADVGKAISVKVSYTDLQGTAESKTSAATALVANVNDPTFGTVYMAGMAIQNMRLTVSNDLFDEDGMGTVSYQWKRNGVAISGATGTTYTLVQADVGMNITATASHTDLQGTAQSRTTPATVRVVNVNDPVTGEVTISGTPTQNQVLTASNTLDDIDGLGAITYQWKRGGVAISGATGTTYTLVQADVGSAITVTASYTDLQGTAESVTSAATAAVANVNDSPTGTVTISGIPTQYQVLTASNTLVDIDGLGSITYQWKRNGVQIASGTSYALTQADVGKKITVTASYTDLQGTAESVTSAETALVANVNDAATGSVSIAGFPTQNAVLTASNTLVDIDGLGPITYQWKSGGVAISGATGSTYTLREADVNKKVTVTASYIDLLGTPESVTSAETALVVNVNDPLVGYVMIGGDLTQGQTLTASNSFSDVDGLGEVSYKWLKNGSIINGAVGSTYLLTPADIGAKFSVTGSYTDGHGAQESKTSAETFPIQPIRTGYSLQTKGIASVPPTPPVNGKIIIASTSEMAITTSDNAAALSAMTSVEKQSLVKYNVSALLTKYAPSSGSDKLYVSKSLLPFAVTSPLIDTVELLDAKSSSVASPLVCVGDASAGAVYIDTVPGNSITLTYSPDTVAITHTSESGFSVVINGAAAVNKLVGDKILLKSVVLTLGSITAAPNNLPVFVKNAPTTVFEDASYSHTVSVSDADNDTFTVTAPILPSWLTFNQATGTLSCPSVPSSVVGSHAVQLLAEDIWSGKTYYDFTITVQNVPVTGTVTSSASLKYSDLNTVQTPILKAIQVSESDATVIINTATVNGVDVRSYLQLGAGPSNYTVTVKSGQHAALLTLLRTNPGNVSVAIKITDISTPASPIYVIETIPVLNDSPTTTQQFPSSMTIIEDSSTAYAQFGGADSTITFSEACSVVLNGTYKDYFMLVATDGTSRTYKLKCKDLASARAIIPGTSYSLTVTATSSANALTVTSNSLSVQATNILTTAIVGGAKILTHASLQAYITSSVVIPNIATITLSESDPQSITMHAVTVNGSSVDKTYFTVSGSSGNYVLSVNTSAASQLLTRLSALITSRSAYSMLMTFQVVEQGGNAFTQTITVAASNNIIQVSLKPTVTNVPNMVGYSVNGSVATVVMNYSATPVIDYADYIISDANSAVGTRVVGGGIAYDGAILPAMYAGVSLVKSMVYQSPGEWTVTYHESYSGATGSQSNTLTLKFSVRGAINFVLPALNASFELGDVLHILGEYTAPDAYALPTITLSMSASLFNDGLFQLALTDSYINTLVNPATEAVYHSEKITYYTNDLKFPTLKNTANVLLKDLPVVNGATVPAKRIRQRNAETDRLAASMVHELAYQAIGVSLMDDQLDNGEDLKAAIDNYLTTALPAFVKSKIADANGKTQNISAVSDSDGRDNVPRELFMQIVESCVGGTTGGENAKSSRLTSLFEASNLAGGKYGIKFIAGDSLRFSITIAPHSVDGVVQDIDYIVDGAGHPVQEARTVELIISMTA